MSLLFTWPLLMALDQAPDGVGAADAANAAERADETERLAREEAARYEIVLGEERDAPLELHETPILKWSNPNAGALFGSVFLWTDGGGRPRVVASIYRWYTPKQEFHAEFKSLADVPLTATRDDGLTWDARSADVAFLTLQDAPTPGGSAAARLRQMRVLARRFTAEANDPEFGPHDLRLLTQPVYRYPEQSEGVIDGAVFAFTQGTDPEVLLLLEAAQIDGETHWRYAVSRMNMYELHVSLDGNEVWTVEGIAWEEFFRGSGPYRVIELAYDRKSE